MYQYGQRVASGEVDDPSFFMAWYEPKKVDSDYRDPLVWAEANPGIGDLSDPEDFESSILRTPEAEFKTKRLNMWVATQNTWLPEGAWNSLDVGPTSHTQAPIILGLDGSFNNDSTAVIACSIEETPHIWVVGAWEKPAESGNEWSVPIFDVEEAIRKACKSFNVREIVCDPYRWARSMQALQEEGLPIVEFPQSPQRMVPATQRFYEAVMNKTLTHDGDVRLTRHMNNAVLKTDNRGQRLSKDARYSARKIDLAVAAVMAFDRAATPIIQEEQIEPGFWAV
jgi:phage terminase large subunit-like protein